MQERRTDANQGVNITMILLDFECRTFNENHSKLT